MNIEYRSPTIDEYQTLRNLVGWWRTNGKATEKALNNSLFSIVSLDQDRVIGFGRVIGDGGLYFYIQDVIVHPNHQNKGIGKILMQELMNYISANAKPGAFIGLMAAQGLEKYHASFGFKTRDADAPGMYQVLA